MRDPNNLPSSGWQCWQQSTVADRAWIDVYYNDTRRAAMDLQFVSGSRLDWIRVCDTNLNDNIRPGLRVEISTGAVYEYPASTIGDGCRTWDRSYTVLSYRGVTRTPSGALQHGTIPYRL